MDQYSVDEWEASGDVLKRIPSITSNAFLADSLSHIRFYSGSDDSSFIGNSFRENSLSPYQVRPVPEPETYATAALLLIGLGIYAYRRRHATSSQVS